MEALILGRKPGRVLREKERAEHSTFRFMIMWELLDKMRRELRGHKEVTSVTRKDASYTSENQNCC